jgi:glycosyltransferase involved in cell wall biosynthesis
VGREGWTQLPEEQRRNIPQTMEKLRRHPELGKRLIWLSDISDQYLEQVYRASSCLLFASEAEGFGLPLIEAARHGKPIIARNIAVFREITRDHAHYFDGQTPKALARAVQDWIALNKEGKAPSPSGLAWNTWQQNAEKLLELLDL